MFNHFIQNMAVRYKQSEPDSYKHESVDSYKQTDSSLIDAPTPNFYQLFEERINSRRTRTAVDRSGYKNALNKRVKLLKARLKDLVGTEDLQQHESVDSYKQTDSSLIDAPTPNFYQLFEERINSRRTRTTVDRSGYKNALNKRVKLLKARLKDLVG
ncbi:DENN/MADD domain containing 2D [Operophtera brumata]|uniref:DENN/MADD domain containing 2D n=1 Tax=Operophtera brumata TaxID=104452 RepID=A0A0L7L3I2_OPEBR|nr:DENN/MADD domain containing 2D [Operophtera brumata]